MSDEVIDRKQFDKRRDFKHLLNQKDLQYIKDSFKERDTNNTNELDIDQLRETFEKYGINIDRDESFQKLLEEAENNGRTSIDFDQLIDLITLNLSNLESMEDLEKIFSLYIGDENLDKIEFRHLRKVCPGLTDEEIKEMIEKADSDKDGKVNFEDFFNIITKKI